ncbi:hypothetical protein P7F88_25110 [Vibrio hannami]|uniref:hypothetical protein n=1 Tax=Vibrio hannami TaxID=2717094 RepID=UPI002410A39C|nr:hypothetical protein [Vibrio hannami]MDG3089144.1 hypothetical protein [Vibrio hannami]
MFVMLKSIKFWLVAGLVTIALAGLAYLSYDYGVTSTEADWQAKELKAKERYDAEVKAIEAERDKQRDRANGAEQRYESEKGKTKTKFVTVKQEVIKYVQKNPDSKCIVNDAEWLRIRAANIKANRKASDSGDATREPDDSTG